MQDLLRFSCCAIIDDILNANSVLAEVHCLHTKLAELTTIADILVTGHTMRVL